MLGAYSTPLALLGGSPLRIAVGMGTCGKAAGAERVLKACAAACGDVQVAAVGCRGMCWAEPLVCLIGRDGEERWYANVEEADVASIATMAKHAALVGLGKTEDSLADKRLPQPEEMGFTSHQVRRVMSDCGIVDPTSIEEYRLCGGFSALDMALEEMDPEDVIALVSESGLRGRGGAGFPTGKKWRAVFEASRKRTMEPFVVVNADEGDPGAYMDRALLESDPFLVIEGVMICAFAIGARKGYLFIRSEYREAVKSANSAVMSLRRQGILGDRFDIAVVESAGAYLCGEETALISVLENRPPYPARRPPYPAERGIFGHPTCVNNVETFANIPGIVIEGPVGFKSAGTSESPGTKVFSLSGSIERCGLVEVGLGTPIDVVVKEIGGAGDYKAVQVGGPSGIVLPASEGKRPLAYEDLGEVGGFMGSGGVVVLDDRRCVVETVRYFMEFNAQESCGRCEACREGTLQCEQLLSRITAGEGVPADLARLEDIARDMEDHALCGLGRAAAHPLLSALHHFREEFESHLAGSCPALSCNALLRFRIDQDKCQGERCCLLTCPGNAIRGGFGKPGRIVERLCQHCWSCALTCPYGAVVVESGARFGSSGELGFSGVGRGS